MQFGNKVSTTTQ